MSEELHIKILGLPLGGLLGRGKPKLPKDGDGDGLYTPPGSDKDTMPLMVAIATTVRQLRKTKPTYQMPKETDKRASAQRWLKEALAGGFTTDKNMGDDVKKGISIGRNYHGLSVSMKDVFEDDGEVKPEAIDRVLAWLEFHGEKPFNNPLDGAREAGIGGWVENEQFYLDIVDIYETNAKNLEMAKERGAKQDQKSVAILEKIWEAKENGKWDDAFINTGGKGSSVIPWSFFDELSKMVSSSTKPKSNFRNVPKGLNNAYRIYVKGGNNG